MKNCLKEKLKKTASIAMSAIMLAALLPTAAFAEEITPPATQSYDSHVTVEGESIEVTVTIIPDAEDPSKTTVTVETPAGGEITQSGAEVVYSETEVNRTTVNGDGTQTVTDNVEGSYTYEKESDGTENAPDVTVELFKDGEEVENPSASEDAGLLPPGQPEDPQTGEVIIGEAVENTGDQAIYGENGRISDRQTITGQPERIVTADADATGVQITEGSYEEGSLGDGYDYGFKSSNHPDNHSDIVFYYKHAGSDSWDYQYAARQVSIVDINGTPDDKSDDVLFDSAYCIDETTSVPAGALKGELGSGDILYRLANLEDSGYYPDTADGTIAEDHLRYIVLNGYSFAKPAEGQTTVSTAANTESLNAVIEMMKNAVDEDGNALYPGIDFNQLTAVEAANATQMAIWRYGNQEGQLYDFQARYTNSSDAGKAASADRINALYNYLIKGTMTAQQAEAQNSGSTEIINEDKFIKDMSITVGQKSDKEEYKAVNTDADKDNDVYNVDLSFTLYVEPGEKDDLVVSILDADGNVIRKARIAGDDSNDDANIFVKLFRKDDNPNSYTFKDLQLAENSDVSFDLTLEGIQYLKEGVYIYRPMGYTAADGTVYSDGETSQTFVTKRSGTAAVDVKAKVNINFNVDEADIKIDREWKYQVQYDLQVIDGDDPGDDPENPTDPEDPTDPDDPEDKKDTEEKKEELPVGGGVIDTGDSSGGRMAMLALVNIFSAFAAFAVILKLRKVKEN